MASQKGLALTPLMTTATRIPTRISQSPGNVTLMEKSEIKKRTPRQISDMISVMAGVRVSKDVGYQGREQLFIRGIPYGTIVMLDGVILNDLEGEMRVIQSINAYDIDRIEVVRGPFSSLYGTGGIGGVVNFITEMPAKFESTAVLSYGNELDSSPIKSADKNLARGYFSLGDVFFNHRLKLKATYAFTHSDGAYRVPVMATQSPIAGLDVTINHQSIDPKTNNNAGWLGRTGYGTQDGRLRLGYDWGEKDTTDLDLHILYLKENEGVPDSNMRDTNGVAIWSYMTNNGSYSPFLELLEAGRRKEWNYIASISHKHYFSENADLSLKLSSVDLISHFVDGLSSATIFGGRGISLDNYASSNYFDAVYTNRLSKKHTFLLGFQGRYSLTHNERNYVAQYNQKNFWNHYDGFKVKDYTNAYTLALWASWVAKWDKTFSTNMGLRLDYWQNFNDKAAGYEVGKGKNMQNYGGFSRFFPSPKAAINYNPFPYTTIKASMGLAFRAPVAREMYLVDKIGKRSRANPYLKPEYGIEYELGLEQRNPYGGVAKIYFYQTDLFDAIYEQGDGKSIASAFRNINGGHNRILGIEAEVIQKIWGDLSADLNYTYTHAQVVDNPNSPQDNGKFLAGIPKHMMHLSLLYGREKGFFGSLQVNAISGAYNSIKNSPILNAYKNYYGHISADVKIGYTFSNQLWVSLSFLNFTDSQYFDYYKAPGASFYLEVGGRI
ncbi:TonB-dependent receptor [Helicobacter sp. 12S02634-8]|uniref:TonB-dependent receptor n=1 Tax=Helicobacter sp. 12S02634-8 TaxID=1476199 RepID=UPI001557A80E|nr:TonB-dependent receptor [Helicobacter sp. 12S02634-8]